MAIAIRRALVLMVACCSLFGLAACSTAAGPSNSLSQSSQLGSQREKVFSQDSTFADADGADAGALANLWRSRSGENQRPDFVLGPGDVLRIGLPQLENLKDVTVRVLEDDTISLPLVGVIDVKGMTEGDLRRELARRAEKYVYRPQVYVYLQHSENQLVAVLGAVKTPGRYMLTTDSDTLMTMISRAGGTTKDAAARIIFIPAPLGNGETSDSGMHGYVQSTAMRLGAHELTAPEESRSQAVEGATVTPEMLAEGIVIDLSHPANQRYLAMPARAGDVIIVPAAGEATVQGWVDKPGAFPITPGMTALGAIAAAGGALFTSSATLLRDEGAGNKVSMRLDLARIKAGTAPDVVVQSGDVIIVNRSVAGAVPYSLYFLVSHTGLGLPVMPF